MKIILTSMILFASGAPLGLKDRPEVSHTQAMPSRPPTPSKNRLEPIQPYVYIEGGGNAKLPLTPEEMEVYGLRTGDTIPLKDASRIVKEMLERQGR